MPRKNRREWLGRRPIVNVPLPGDDLPSRRPPPPPDFQDPYVQALKRRQDMIDSYFRGKRNGWDEAHQACCGLWETCTAHVNPYEDPNQDC